MLRAAAALLTFLFSSGASALTFTNQDGKTVSPGDWKGGPFIVSLAYTTCPSTCSFTVENLKKLEQQLGDGPRPPIKVFTIDPQTDTPEVLKAYKKKLGVDWEFLTADKKTIREYLGKFSLNFGEKAAAGNHVMHPNVILLVESDGKSWLEATGISPDFSKIIQTVRKSKASSTER